MQVYDIASSPGGLDMLGLGWWPDVFVHAILPPLNHLKLRWRQVTSIRLPGTFLGLRNGLNFQADDAMMLFVAPGSMSSTWSWRFAILILRSYVERTLGYNFEIARYLFFKIHFHP